MNSLVLFALCLGMVATISADCDVLKCITAISDLDYSDTKKSCPVMKTAIGCMENVINTCAALGDNKASVETPLKSAKENYEKVCGAYGAAGFVQAKGLFVAVAVFVAIWSRS